MESSRDDFVIAIRSAFLKKGYKQRFSLLSLILFSIIFLILGNFNFKIINYNKAIIKEIIYFSASIVTIPENIIKNYFNDIVNHFEYYDEYQKIKKELQELKNKDLSKKIITFENIELKKLIDDYFVEDSQLYAKVLLDKESPFLRSIVINKGSKNDVKAGMIVYDDIYLVGKVVEVNYLTSRVLLVSDINSKVPVTVQPLNIEAIMSGYDIQTGKLQYVMGDKLINNNNKELMVVTSGSGGVFKSGIPIGKINMLDIPDNNEIIVNFYKDFSQLKYVKISSHTKKLIKFDKSNKKLLNTQKKLKEENTNKVLEQQNIIAEEVRKKLIKSYNELNEKFLNTQKKLEEQTAIINKVQIENEDLEFLKLNLLYGHKCRKTFLKAGLYKIHSPKYRACVLNKGLIKKN